MKIIETRVTVSAIHLWLANDSELHNATAWLELELSLENLDSCRTAFRRGRPSGSTDTNPESSG